MVCTLGVVLPITFVAGIAARRALPVVASVPGEFVGKGANFGEIVWTKTDLWPEHRIITSLRRDGVGSMAIELMFQDLVKPDVLVYWVPGKENTGDGLPDNARLLGALANRTTLSLPSDMHGEVGRFLLYSLAEHEVVATSKPFTIQRFNDSTI